MNIKYLKILLLGAVLLLTSISTVKAQNERPGGLPATGGNYSWTTWLVPENYNPNTGEWTNLINTVSSSGTFFNAVTNPLVDTNDGFNFHPAVVFNKTAAAQANNRLRSTNLMSYTAGQNFTSIIVYRKRNTLADNAVIAYHNGTTAGSHMLSWGTANSHVLTHYWPATALTYPSNTTNPQASKGMMVVNNPNMANSPLVFNANGYRYQAANTTAGTATMLNNHRIYLGSNANSRNGYQGLIQEVILLNKVSGGSYLQDIDLVKVQSYLAVKYGITLKPNTSNENYLNSASTAITNGIVWDRTANEGFDKNIFGIARDDNTRLYQKQGKSEENENITAFVGSELKKLNKDNDGALQNMQYLMFGAKGSGPVKGLTDFVKTGYLANDKGKTEIEGDEEYEIQSGAIYKTQLTGPVSSMKVKIKVGVKDFRYILVSTEETFEPNKTKFYEIDNYVAEIEVDQNFKFIKFIGLATGPGGVLGNNNALGQLEKNSLKLWLRADDATSLDLVHMTNMRDPRMVGVDQYGSLSKRDTGDFYAVNKWSDLIRTQTYSYPEGNRVGATTNAPARMPYMQYNNPLMNFHPAVRFWSDPGDAGSSPAIRVASYLNNTNTNVMQGIDSDNKHTAIFVVSQDFRKENWFYAMGFGKSSLTQSGSTYNSPAWGAQNTKWIPNFYSGTYGTGGVNRKGEGLNGLRVVGRFRTNTQPLLGDKDLFEAGATSINTFRLDGATSPTANKMLFRFNAQQGQTVRYTNTANTNFENSNGDVTRGSINFATASTLGSAYGSDRTISGVMSEVILFNTAIQDTLLNRIESYLAIKYGVTLYPDITGTANGSFYGRYNYKFSDGSDIWRGDVLETDPEFGKFAKFYNNVAAIIRDDAASLDNRQSHSTNVGSVLRLGVPGESGAYLSNEGEGLGRLEPMEAIAFGSNKVQDETIPFVGIEEGDLCSAFDERFSKIWLIHKTTDNNVQVIVGAEDNRDLPIGNDPFVYANYYEKLSPGYDVTMIVFGSAPTAKDANGNDDWNNHKDYAQIVDMHLINGIHQCSYEFSQTDTYITFGYRPNLTRGCFADQDIFLNGRAFDWAKWPLRAPRATANYNNNSTNPIAFGGDLIGSGAEVKELSVQYKGNSRAPSGYPRAEAVNRVSHLNLRRTHGNFGISGDVELKIKLTQPLRTSFTISGINRLSNTTQVEQVEITGVCTQSGTEILPTLTYEGTASASWYNIERNRATAKPKGTNTSASNTDKNGRVKVLFNSGVDEITIVLRIIGPGTTASSTARGVWISPLTFDFVPPPPLVNRFGISFSKELRNRPGDRNLFTCEPVEYAMEIGNRNYTEKTVTLSDTLPQGLVWDPESFAILEARADSLNLGRVPGDVSVEENGPYAGRVLTITNLEIPCNDKLTFIATANFTNDVFDTKTFDNQAWLKYEVLGAGNKPESFPHGSLDKRTQNPYAPATSFDAEYVIPLDDVTVDSQAKETFRPNETITVKYVINNTNDDTFGNIFSEINFNPNFTYAGGFEMKGPDGQPVAGVKAIDYASTTIPDADRMNGVLLICKSETDEGGYDIGKGTYEITFKLKAPTKAILDQDIITDPEDPAYDGGKVPDLVVDCGFATIGDMDVCKAAKLAKMFGSVTLLYEGGRSHIITNTHITASPATSTPITR